MKGESVRWAPLCNVLESCGVLCCRWLDPSPSFHHFYLAFVAGKRRAYFNNQLFAECWGEMWRCVVDCQVYPVYLTMCRGLPGVPCVPVYQCTCTLCTCVLVYQCTSVPVPCVPVYQCTSVPVHCVPVPCVPVYQCTSVPVPFVPAWGRGLGGLARWPRVHETFALLVFRVRSESLIESWRHDQDQWLSCNNLREALARRMTGFLLIQRFCLLTINLWLPDSQHWNIGTPVVWSAGFTSPRRGRSLENPPIYLVQ